MPNFAHYLALQPNPYSLALVVVGLLAGVLCRFMWRRRLTTGATSMTLFMFAVMIWSFGYAAELASQDVATMLFYFRLEAPGILVAPIAWLLFVLQYTGRERWLTRRSLALLCTIPALMFVVLYTNEWHHLYFTSLSIARDGPFLLMELAAGPLYAVDSAYGMLLAITGVVLLVRHLLHQHHLHRMQMWMLVLAIMVPLCTSVMYVTGWTPIPYLDLTPFAFVVTGSAVAWGIYHLHFLDVTPLARDLLIGSMQDGVLVLDERGVITDLNGAAQRYLVLDETVVGHPVQTVHSCWSGLAAFCATQGRASTEVLVEESVLLYLDVSVSPVFDKGGKRVGRLLLLRDITARKVAEAAVQARLAAEAASRAKSLFLAIMTDELNRGVPSDRCQVDWRLNSAHVVQRVQAPVEAQSAQHSWEPANLAILPTQLNAAGFATPIPAPLPDDGRPLALPIPSDVAAIRRADRELSMAWRLYLRAVLEEAFNMGCIMVDCVHLPDRGWHYILVREYL